MECDVHYAKTNLSKLIRLVEAGQDVFITRRGEPVVQLQAVVKAKPRFGTLAGRVPPTSDSVMFAMSDDDADAFVDGNW